MSLGYYVVRRRFSPAETALIKPRVGKKVANNPALVVFQDCQVRVYRAK